MIVETCKNCQYFFPFLLDAYPNEGDCVKHPPDPAQLPTNKKCFAGRLVRTIDSCNEFKLGGLND